MRAEVAWIGVLLESILVRAIEERSGLGILVIVAASISKEIGRAAFLLFIVFTELRFKCSEVEQQAFIGGVLMSI